MWLWVPIILIAMGGVAFAARRGNMSAPPVNPSDWSGWVWPVPVTNGRTPTITDGFSATKTKDHRKHLGVDIMFPKRAGDPKGKVKHSASFGFIAPQGTYVIAAGPGKVWSAGVDSYGHWVRLDHGSIGGFGVTTRYAHLESFDKPWKKGDKVAAGDILGPMGFSPANDSEQLRHLHFELSFPAGNVEPGLWPADPAPYMRHWRKIPLQEALV